MSFVDHKSKFTLRKAECMVYTVQWPIGFHIGNFKTEQVKKIISINSNKCSRIYETHVNRKDKNRTPYCFFCDFFTFTRCVTRRLTPAGGFFLGGRAFFAHPWLFVTTHPWLFITAHTWKQADLNRHIYIYIYIYIYICIYIIGTC